MSVYGNGKTIDTRLVYKKFIKGKWTLCKTSRWDDGKKALGSVRLAYVGLTTRL